MGKFSFYESQILKPGKLIEVELHEFSPHPKAGGKLPIALIEHIGDDNETWLNEQFAEANSTEQQEDAKADAKADAASKADDKMKDAEAALKRYRANRARARRLCVKHVVRGFRNVYSDDGTEATADDVPELVGMWPDEVIQRLTSMAQVDRNFIAQPIVSDQVDKETPTAEIIAGKS